MHSGKNAEILALIERLNNDIKLAKNHSLESTARMLQIVVLDLKTIIYSISDDELRQFSDFIEDRTVHDNVTSLDSVRLRGG